jgi:hypothetical protein
MSNTPGGNAHPKLFYSVAELTNVLDRGTAAAPGIPAVRVVHLPDRPEPKRRKTATATVANPPPAEQPWWLNTGCDSPAAPPSSPVPASKAEIGRPLHVRKPWSAMTSLADWRLASAVSTAAVVVMSVLSFAFWVLSSQSQAADDVQMVLKVAPAATARPVIAELIHSEVLPVPQEQDEVQDRINEIDKNYAKVVADFEKELRLLRKEKEPAACETCEAKKPKGSYGTAVDFVNNPIEAAEMALSAKKLFMVLTISGNFEESKFT